MQTRKPLSCLLFLFFFKYFCYYFILFAFVVYITKALQEGIDFDVISSDHFQRLKRSYHVDYEIKAEIVFDGSRKDVKFDSQFIVMYQLIRKQKSNKSFEIAISTRDTLSSIFRKISRFIHLERYDTVTFYLNDSQRTPLFFTTADGLINLLSYYHDCLVEVSSVPLSGSFGHPLFDIPNLELYSPSDSDEDPLSALQKDFHSDGNSSSYTQNMQNSLTNNNTESANPNINSQSHSSFSAETSSNQSPSASGIIGLDNLGNTCFLNSSLQCLFQAVPFASLFLSYRYIEHLNPSNVLSKHGEIANVFACLIKEVFDNSFAQQNGQGRFLLKNPYISKGFQYSTLPSIRPSLFLSVFSHFFPQFSGGHQQDAQEFLNVLLDALV